MAKAPKTNCPHCDGKMPVGISFCPSCAHPTPWCSYDERVEWEVLQYRRLRERPAEHANAAGGAVATVEAPARSYRTASVLKQPVTVKIEKRFGPRATAQAKASAPVREKPRPAAPEPVEPVVEAPTVAPQIPEAASAAKPAIEEPPTEKPTPRTRARASRPTSAKPDTSKSAAKPSTRAGLTRARPTRSGSTRETPARPADPPARRKPVQRDTEPTVEHAPAVVSPPRSDDIEAKLALVEVLAARVEQLEARISELSRTVAPKVSWWRRFLGD